MKINESLDILLVEDSPEDIDLAREALDTERVKNRLHVVKDGEKAVSYLKDKKAAVAGIPDLIVLDLNLPKKNGFEVLEDIQRDESLRKIPVIILSTSELSSDEFKSYKIDPQLYVKKSVDFHEFAKLVRSLLEDPQSVLVTSAASGNFEKYYKKALKILLVEDNPADVDLVNEILFMKEKSHWLVTSVPRLEEALDCLSREEFDVITLDLFLPDSMGLESLAKIAKCKPQVPVIVVTGLNDEKFGVASLRKGAQDYLIKGQITADLFVRSVEYAIERKQLEQFKDDMLGYVNHELNNPLTVIKEGIAQVAEGLLGELNAKQQQYLEKSLHHIDRLVRITNDLLMCTKLEFGKFPLEKEDFDLIKVAEDVLATYRSLKKSPVELVLTASCDQVQVLADKSRIEQVLVNLVGNGLKFTEEGKVLLEIVREGAQIRCAVKDTGPGIKPEDLPRIFEKFDRSPQNKLKKISGNGLGLYICKRLVELHDGRIWAESVVNKGTAISFTLPAPEAAR